MTKLLEQALQRVRLWPKELQDDAARLLIALDRRDTEPFKLTPEQRTEVRAALKEVDDGEIATDQEIGAVFRRYGL